MKLSLITCVVIAFVLCLCLPQAMMAEDGGGLFKARCAACHGAEGQGKVGPALKGTSLSEGQISDLLTKGMAGKKPPHAKAVNGITDDQAKAVAAFVKTLK
jgi:cytochrome c